MIIYGLSSSKNLLRTFQQGLDMKIALSLFLLLIANTAYAEGGTCPPGYYPVNSPGVMGCAPIPNDNQSSTSAAPARERWVTRWGAIAIDDTAVDGGLGAVSDMTSKRNAEKAALASCRNSGGTACNVKFSYYNQCTAIAWGDTGYNAARAATIEKASEIGIRECNAKHANCKIYYSACSLPERIQ